MERNRDPQPEPLSKAARAAISQWYEEYLESERAREEVLACALWNVTCQKLVSGTEAFLQRAANE